MKNFYTNSGRLLPVILWMILCISMGSIFACQKSTSDASLSVESDAAVKSIESIEEFKSVMTSSHEKLIVIDFYADWCGPCRQLAPLMEKIAHEMAADAAFYKLNIDDHRMLSMKNGVTGIPYVAFYKEEKKVHSLMGIWPKDNYIQTVKQFTFPQKPNTNKNEEQRNI